MCGLWENKGLRLHRSIKNQPETGRGKGILRLRVAIILNHNML